MKSKKTASPYEFLAPALRAKGFDEKQIRRACGLVRKVNGDQVRVLAAMLDGLMAMDAAAYAAKVLRDGCPSEEALEEAARLLTPAPAAEADLGAELDAVGRPHADQT